MSSRTWSLVLACLAALACASPAQAVSRYRIARGEAPGVAVDANGVAHVAFNAESVAGAGQPIMYCAVPKGSRKCTPRPILNDGESAEAQPALVATGPAPNELWVTSVRRLNTIVYLHSLDNGATWSGPVTIGQGRYFDGAFGPGGQIAYTFREEFRLRSFTTPPDDSAVAEINTSWPLGDSVVGWFQNRPVVVTGGANPGFAVSSWSGTGDIHDPATWFGPYRIGSANYFALAGGPRGLWLLQEQELHDATARMEVRHFNGRKFGRPHRISAGRLGTTPIVTDGFGQSSGGRMAAVWYADVRNRFEYSVSKTGKRWTAARVLATGVELPFYVKVALGPDGRGVVVWDENSGGDVNVVRINAAHAR
jgi:hypothetical protein